jgi:hypothetical protein
MSPALRLSRGTDNRSMVLSRGNSDWGKPDTGGPVEVSLTSIEKIVEHFGLSPDQYIRSAQLREWARTNKNSKYIPDSLFKAWVLRFTRISKRHFVETPTQPIAMLSTRLQQV